MTTQYSAAANYMRDLHRYPLLTDKEFDLLIHRARKGDRKAVNKIVQGNLRFVVQVAAEYNYTSVPFTDLIAEGNIGLLKAVEKFDPNLGYKFSTYAVWWIRNAIQRSLRQHRHPLRLPFNRQEDLDRLYKASETLSQKLGRQVSPEEAAQHLHMTHRRAAAAIHVQKQTLSLDTPLSDDFQEGFLHEQIPDNSERPDETFERIETSDRLMRAVQHLNKRDAHIIDLTFGFNDEPISLTEVGHRLGISKERVRQIRNRALRQLRQLLDQEDPQPLAIAS